MNKTEHLLTCLMEECSEIQKEAAKALRFGLEDRYYETTPAENITREYIDLIAVMEMLEEEESIKNVVTIGAIQTKKDRVLKYMKYAEEHGTLKEN